MLLPDLRDGGAERVQLSLAEGFHRRGHIVDLVVMQTGRELDHLVPQGVRLIDLGATRVRNLMPPLVRYLRAERPAGVVAAMWPLTSMTVLARIMARIPSRVVVSDHNMLSRQYADRGRHHHMALRASMSATYRLADARVVVSAGLAPEIARLASLAPGDFHVIPNPVPLPEQLASPTMMCPDWPRRGPKILSVGHLKRQKNHLLLLEAFALLDPALDASLVILGEGEMRPKLLAAAERLGLQDRVSLPGFKPDPWPWFRAADLFVLSSDYEGMGNVLVEALGAGLRIVSTDCPSGPAEILAGGRFGRLVDVGDAQALAAAMTDALASEPCREGLMKRAQDFSPDRAVVRYEKLLLPSDGRGRDG